MKHSTRWPTYLAVAVLGVGIHAVGCSSGTDPESATLERGLPGSASNARVQASVEPVRLGGPSVSAIEQCAAIGSYQYACKIDGWGDNDMNGMYFCPMDPWEGDSGHNEIRISNSDGTAFDWSARKAVGAVIVKGDDAANVFHHDSQEHAYARLSAPSSTGGGPAAVRQVTVCWNADTR